MTSLQGRTLIMSGGSRGIGLAIALRAAADGANVTLIAKTDTPHPSLPGTIHTAVDEINQAGGRGHAVVGDIRDDSVVQRAVDETVEIFGGIDIVVNNASAIDLSTTDEIEMKRYDLMQDVNCRGTLLLSKLSLPHLRRSAAAGGTPHILTLSPPLNLNPSWAGQHLPYTIAKYGMSLTTLGLAEELRGESIAVNSLWPQTTIATAAVRNLLGGEEMVKRSRTPEIVADAAQIVLTSDGTGASGQFLIDDQVLTSAGATDLDRYRAVDGDEPLQRDLFLDR